MARPSGEKNRCSGQWTEAKFHSFIKSMLRQGTRKWAPIQQCLKEARVRRGWYLCAYCNQEVPATILTTLKNGKTKRVKNAIADHLIPVVPPEVGFTTWDDLIEGMYCEIDNIKCCCHACHQVKCAEEAAIAKERRAKEKQEKLDE